MKILVPFYVDLDDVQTAIAMPQAEGKRVSRKAVLDWCRDKYSGYGNSDVNNDLLSSAGIDLDYHEEAWAAVQEAVERFFPYIAE